MDGIGIDDHDDVEIDTPNDVDDVKINTPNEDLDEASIPDMVLADEGDPSNYKDDEAPTTMLRRSGRIKRPDTNTYGGKGGAGSAKAPNNDKPRLRTTTNEKYERLTSTTLS